jgi:hypothetical protein
MSGTWYMDRKKEVPPGKLPYFVLPILNWHAVRARAGPARLLWAGGRQGERVRESGSFPSSTPLHSRAMRHAALGGPCAGTGQHGGPTAPLPNGPGCHAAKAITRRARPASIPPPTIDLPMPPHKKPPWCAEKVQKSLYLFLQSRMQKSPQQTYKNGKKHFFEKKRKERKPLLNREEF